MHRLSVNQFLNVVALPLSNVCISFLLRNDNDAVDQKKKGKKTKKKKNVTKKNNVESIYFRVICRNPFTIAKKFYDSRYMSESLTLIHFDPL